VVVDVSTRHVECAVCCDVCFSLFAFACANPLTHHHTLPRYDSASRVVRVTRMLPPASGGAGDGGAADDGGSVEREESFVLGQEFPTLFDWLQAQLDARSLSPKTRGSLWKKHVGTGGQRGGHGSQQSGDDGDDDNDDDYPFPFAGGFVGFFAYEMRRECGSACDVESIQSDASFVYTERFVAIDHARGRVYAVALCDLEGTGAGGNDDVRVVAAEATAWISSTLARASRALVEWEGPVVVDTTKTGGPPVASAAATDLPEITLRHDYNSYTHNINECLREIYGGESYELCLTNQISAPLPSCDVRPAAVYHAMRQLNPAPYGALLRFGDFWVLQVNHLIVTFTPLPPSPPAVRA
jgi:hypothetical protein